MAEETEGPESDVEAGAGSVDSAAMALALGSASHAEADDFLRKQSRVADLQAHHLQEQFKALRLRIWEQRFGVLLRVGTALVGFAIAATFGAMVWSASRSNELLVEPFSVPPDLAQKGLTGEVVAAKILDRLVTMQAQTSSTRAPASYANSWDQRGIRLDIPETGMSLAELDNFLREKLGHIVHVGGEIVHTASGLSLTVRTGGEGASSITGSESDLDILVQRSAESVFGLSQPFRYTIYLGSHGRGDEAAPILKVLAETGSSQDRPWGYIGLSRVVKDSTSPEASLALAQQALALKPNFPNALSNVSRLANERSQPELTIRMDNKMLTALSGGSEETIRTELVPLEREAAQAEIDLELGAFQDSAREQADVVRKRLPGRYGLSADLARSQTGEHDLAAARATLAEPVRTTAFTPGFDSLTTHVARMLLDSEAQDWAGIESDAAALAPLLAKYPGVSFGVPTMVAPVLAYAEAKLGKVAAAEARIATTPADCYACLIARARIAELRGQRGRADYWFARAVAVAPSIPFAYSHWGDALLARGKPDDAIAEFKTANQKGPHFADPLEGWGEALMANNQSHLALAKFAEAEKYAPNWGRLHLKWGEALAYAGRKDEAKAQFARAAALDLTAAEKSELAGTRHG
jgi:hypothetical protein